MSGNGDYISREAANEACWKAVRRCPNSFYNGIEAARDAIRKLPAADVRPVVRGKWEDVFVRDYSTNINGGMELHIASMFCSICHRWHNEIYHYGNPTEMAHFCSNCGADMREES